MSGKLVKNLDLGTGRERPGKAAGLVTGILLAVEYLHVQIVFKSKVKIKILTTFKKKKKKKENQQDLAVCGY